MAKAVVGTEKILILDFGSQYTHLVARRLREIKIYSEIRRFDITLEEIEKFQPKGVILSGGPSSVYEAGSPHIRKDVWHYIVNNELPILGICYGLQEMIQIQGGKVHLASKREFGSAILEVVVDGQSTPNPLFGYDFAEEQPVWMSHGDAVVQLPPGFKVIAKTFNCEYAAVVDESRKLYGVQFHPEVTHTPSGLTILKNFTLHICNVLPIWTMSAFAQTQMSRIREIVGDSYVIGALSGGVDSTVAAALLHKSLGKQFIGIVIDNGLLRDHEGAEVLERLKLEVTGLDIRLVDASSHFLSVLKGVTNPETKRKIIGNAFIQQFEAFVYEMGLPLDGSTFLLQGTLYPDVIESVSSKGPSHTIKTHHNVGGLPEKMNLRIIEPFRELFKDEVRALGSTLGISNASLWRHPFPGPGLAIRIIGEVTKEYLEILRKADAIFINTLREESEYDKISQALVVLLPDALSVGVMGDARTYEMTAVLRAVTTRDFMTAEWHKIPYSVLEKVSNRIINEIKGINRVCYDISSKPPATVEWQ